MGIACIMEHHLFRQLVVCNLSKRQERKFFGAPLASFESRTRMCILLTHLYTAISLFGEKYERVAKDSQETHHARNSENFGAPRVLRVLRVSRDGYISPALLFFAEIRDYLMILRISGILRMAVIDLSDDKPKRLRG